MGDLPGAYVPESTAGAPEELGGEPEGLVGVAEGLEVVAEVLDVVAEVPTETVEVVPDWLSGASVDLVVENTHPLPSNVLGCT